MRINLYALGCLLLALFVLGTKYDFVSMVWQKRTAPGMLAPDNPIQGQGEFRNWTHKGYLFRPQASYSVTARVLLKANYWLSPASDLSPIDLTLGWGPMSDQKILDHLNLSSGNRCYYWNAKQFPIPPDEINRHAANTHIIPKDEKILKKLKSVSVGDVVEMHGYLVNIAKADGWHWNTSLTREDSGGGACELLWVEFLEIKR